MADEKAILVQMANNVQRLERRVHVLETVARPEAKGRLAEIFTSPLSVACVLLLDKADRQEDLARLVTGAIGKPVRQEYVSRELRRLKEAGVLGKGPSGAFFIEEGWRELGLEKSLRATAKRLGVTIEPKRRSRRPTGGAERRAR